ERSVVVVSSKSGSTVETDSQKRAYEYAFEQAGLDPVDHIVIVTDPGSPLADNAERSGYRLFTANPHVGGRYSALTAFGWCPAAWPAPISRRFSTRLLRARRSSAPTIMTIRLPVSVLFSARRINTARTRSYWPMAEAAPAAWPTGSSSSWPNRRARPGGACCR